MKKLLNLQSGFSSIDTSWKDKTPIISTETVRTVANLSKTFLQIQSVFIVSNQRQIIFVLRRLWSREKKLLIFKRSSKTFTRNIKAISNSVALCHIFPFNFFVQTDWHQEEPLGCSEFEEHNYLLKRYVCIIAYLGIMLKASWHIREDNWEEIGPPRY